MWYVDRNWQRVFLLLTVAFAAVSRAESDYTINEYGRDCYEKMGVAIPPIDCLSDKATILPVTVNGKPVTEDHPVDKCDRPTYIPSGGYPCAIGSRLLKLEKQNAKGEKIVTMVICRRYRNRPLNDPKFDDIGIIQHNTATDAACWFARTEQGDKPWDGTKVPSPYDPADGAGAIRKRAIDFWESPQQVAEEGRCIRCHSASIWLRTPFVTQAKRDHTHRNAVPDNVNHDNLQHVGKPFAAWNATPPARIYINQDAYDSLFPLTDEEKRLKKTVGLADADTCTQCHGLGKHPWTKSGNCGFFVPSSIGKDPHRNQVADELRHDAWMPPRGKYALASQKDKFEQYYRRAFQAAERCCENPDLTVMRAGKPVKVCQGEAERSEAKARSLKDSLNPSEGALKINDLNPGGLKNKLDPKQAHL